MTQDRNVESLQHYTENLNRDPGRLMDESRRHGGEFVARTRDGLCALAYAPTRDALEASLQEQGVDPQTVVISYVPVSDESRVP